MAPSAYDLLREAIIDGSLQPNERLVEADISSRFGLKPSEVRKALIRLEQDRLVDRELYRGARVHRFTREEVKEILEANAALKSVAVRYAAQRATPEQVGQLRASLTELRRMQETGQYMSAAYQTARLQHQIIGVAGHQTVERLTSLLSAQMARFQYQTILLAGGGDQAIAIHEEIVNAIESHDPDAAAAALERHFAAATRSLEAERAPAFLDLLVS